MKKLKERPYLEVCRGKQITERWLAGKLRPFKIASGDIRIDDEQAKGYESALRVLMLSLMSVESLTDC
jgi:hypothetical protein